MANVTYLLGAGASANAIPTVNQLADSISVTIAILQRVYKKQIIVDSVLDYSVLYLPDNSPYNSFLEIGISDLIKLKNGCINHLSIDTYLKMLYLTKNPDYDKMKATIVLFFNLYKLLYEFIKDYNKNVSKNYRVDMRYDAFFASILEDSYDKFPDNINILSWNYDNQIESTYNKYIINARTSSSAEDLLNIYHKCELETTFDTTKFGIFKLNGTSNYFDGGRKLLPQLHNNLQKLSVRFIEILENYYDCIRNKNLDSAISFAWDKKEDTHKLLETVKRATNNTQILVVIGYSFPFFNRRMDYEIIREMKYLRKVYIQDIDPEPILERFLAIKPDFINSNGTIRNVLVHNTNQLHLPDELT